MGNSANKRNKISILVIKNNMQFRYIINWKGTSFIVSPLYKIRQTSLSSICHHYYPSNSPNISPNCMGSLVIVYSVPTNLSCTTSSHILVLDAAVDEIYFVYICSSWAPGMTDRNLYSRKLNCGRIDRFHLKSSSIRKCF